LQRHAPVLGGHLAFSDRGNFLEPLLNFENRRASCRFVVTMLICAISAAASSDISFAHVTRLQRVLDELARHDAVDGISRSRAGTIA